MEQRGSVKEVKGKHKGEISERLDQDMKWRMWNELNVMKQNKVEEKARFIRSSSFHFFV